MPHLLYFSAMEYLINKNQFILALITTNVPSKLCARTTFYCSAHSQMQRSQEYLSRIFKKPDSDQILKIEQEKSRKLSSYTITGHDQKMYGLSNENIFEFA